MDESHFRTLHELSRNGRISQRELARKVGLSLGRVNFIVNALINKGYVKARRFHNATNKIAYAYILTPAGIKRRVELLHSFIERKSREHRSLVEEIRELKKEAARYGGRRKREMKDEVERLKGI